jgi:DNA-binding NtrC family response regulator
MTGKILIVDDEKDMLILLTRIITEKTDYDVVTTHNPLNAIEILKNQQVNLLITDLKMPKMDGIALLEQAKKIQPAVVVVVMTAYATIETAVEATHKGAFDYIAKPFRKERILLTINNAMKLQGLIRKNSVLLKSLKQQKKFPSIIGSSPAITSILRRIEQVAQSSATILICGESGTGKELVAMAIHHHSHRNDKPFITVNCTAMPEQIIESELFGHVKGAFTGAWKDKKGLVEEANLGTLFFDEIGDLNMVMQAKLLRLLQEAEYKPVGGLTTKHADIRFLAATNQDLRKLIAEKRFREDLFYRLNVINFDIPPLRDRKEDIPALVHHFLEKYTMLNQKEIRQIDPEAMSALMAQKWPGNVRELENIIERGVVLCRSDHIELSDIFPEKSHISPYFLFDQDIYDIPFKEAKENVIKAFHQSYIVSILKQSNGNISRAAERAGLQRQYLHRLIKDENINVESLKENM